MTPPKMVLFDCDGVLVDSEGITNRVMRDNFAGYGLDMTIEQIMNLFVGGTMDGVMIKAREFGAKLPDDWLDEIYGLMLKQLAAEVELVPGVLDVLDALDRAGIVYAVGSNGPHKKMQVTLTRTGLLDRLEGRIYSREDVVNAKPAPDVYLKAAGGISPQDCVVIDDSASGARAGKAAGMTTFGYVADSDRVKMAEICDVIFDDMAELPALLGL